MQHLAGNARGVVPICRKCPCFNGGNKVDIVGVGSSSLPMPTIRSPLFTKRCAASRRRFAYFPVGSANLRRIAA